MFLENEIQDKCSTLQTFYSTSSAREKLKILTGYDDFRHLVALVVDEKNRMSVKSVEDEVAGLVAVRMPVH